MMPAEPCVEALGYGDTLGRRRIRPPVRGVEVPPLTGEKSRGVREAFAELNRLASDDRSAWLLRRLGIIDVLLRGEAVASLPDGSLSEADVFGAVWHAWVSNGASPARRCHP